MNRDFSTLEQKIGFTFTNKQLLTLALTHRSYVNEHPEMREHNERLEFLGDAVLELAVTKYLYETYPNKPEGELTAYRAALVNTTRLSEAAVELDINSFLLLSRGEARDVGKARQFILANTFEALVGAMYLDRGFEAAETFISSVLFPRLDRIIKEGLWQDPKSRFQERAQEKVSVTPSYEVIEETGPDHDKQFTVGVFLGGEKIAEGTGRSKQEAEQGAALKALEAKGWT